MHKEQEDKPLTRKELGSWARLALTVVPIMATILATTWALAGQAKDAENKYLLLEAEQGRQALELKRHSDILGRVPQLEATLKTVGTQLKEHEVWTRRLNDVLIRVETKLGMGGTR